MITSPGLISLVMPLSVVDSSGRTAGGWLRIDAVEHCSTSTKLDQFDVLSSCSVCQGDNQFI